MVFARQFSIVSRVVKIKIKNPAYIFIGLIPKYKELYKYLILHIRKEKAPGADGTAQGSFS